MVATPESKLTILPLENGDRLSRYEFERRYQAMPYLRQAELIEGTETKPMTVIRASGSLKKAYFTLTENSVPSLIGNVVER